MHPEFVFGIMVGGCLLDVEVDEVDEAGMKVARAFKSKWIKDISRVFMVQVIPLQFPHMGRLCSLSMSGLG